MSNEANQKEPIAVEKKGWLGKRLVPLLSLILVVIITASLFFLGHQYPEKVKEFENYGYLGAFLICLISNTSIILPVPGIVVLFALGATLNPVLVGLAGAAGGTIGEITGFMAGYGGRGIARSSRIYARAEKWMRRWGVWAVFLFAATPLPILDIAGIVAGVLGFPLWKFLLIAWVGKSLKYIALVSAGAWGWQALLRYPG